MAPIRHPCLPLGRAGRRHGALRAGVDRARVVVPTAPCFDAHRLGDRAVASLGGAMGGAGVGTGDRTDLVAEEAGQAGCRRGCTVLRPD